MTQEFKPKLEKFGWRISGILRKIVYAKKCDVCGSLSIRFGKREPKILYMSDTVFWGIPIEQEDFICPTCKKEVLLVSPNTQELVILNKDVVKQLNKDDLGIPLYKKARGTIVVIDTDEKLLGTPQLSLTIKGVLFQCLITEHNLAQVLKRYKFIKE